jgi:hypothetical protein
MYVSLLPSRPYRWGDSHQRTRFTRTASELRAPDGSAEDVYVSGGFFRTKD